MKHEVISLTLVQKVKTRTDRQPSKVCISPYKCTKRRLVETIDKVSHVDEVIGGLQLSKEEVASIKFIQNKIAVGSNEVLVRIGESELRGEILSSLVRHAREDAIAKWLNAQIINAYTFIFNDTWANDLEMKHVIPSYHTGWLEIIGKEWLKSGSFKKKKIAAHSRDFCQNLVGSDMVYIPMNSGNNHWWLCVLNAPKQQFQILDSLFRNVNYDIEIRDMAALAKPPKLESRWSNYDEMTWDVVIMTKIPRQNDGCSCGIFTI